MSEDVSQLVRVVNAIKEANRDVECSLCGVIMEKDDAGSKCNKCWDEKGK